MQDEATYQFRAHNGLPVTLRPMRATDAPTLVDLFEHLGEESRYLRFNIPLNDPDPNWVYHEAENLALIEPGNGEGWLAFADLPEQANACVGGIRWIRCEEATEAEVSLVVRDDLHGLGIGTEMLFFIGRRAYEQGVRALMGLIQTSNRALWRALRHLGVPLRRELDGSYCYVKVDLESALAGGVHESPQGRKSGGA